MNLPATIERNVDAYRASTDAAALCREIVVASAQNIQGRKYVKVEGWQAIAVAHGCCASARDVEKVEGGVRAIGEVRRMSDGVMIAEAEGFVGEDEPTWYGGQQGSKTLPKRADYAIRAMAQTRAISRACRSAFAHVVVMMNAGLSTTPAEEVPFGGFDDGNVIEATTGPAARVKLAGPITSKHALKNAVQKIHGLAHEAKGDNERLDAIKDEHKTVINQALRDWPELINGDPNLPEAIGLRAVFEQMRAAEQTEPSASYDALLNAMRQQTTRAQLLTWAEINEGFLADLSDEERRLFEAEFDAYEGGLELVGLAHS